MNIWNSVSDSYCKALRDENIQPYDIKEYSSDMPYRGAAHGADSPASGLISASHARISDRVRKEQLAHLGLETKEEHIDVDEEVENAVKEIKARKLKRMCLLFIGMFVIAIVVGLLVSSFYGIGILMGLGVSATIGFICCLLPMIIYLICYKVKR